MLHHERILHQGAPFLQSKTLGSGLGLDLRLRLGLRSGLELRTWLGLEKGEGQCSY